MLYRFFAYLYALSHCEGTEGYHSWLTPISFLTECIFIYLRMSNPVYVIYCLLVYSSYNLMRNFGVQIWCSETGFEHNIILCNLHFNEYSCEYYIHLNKIVRLVCIVVISYHMISEDYIFSAFHVLKVIYNSMNSFYGWFSSFFIL